MSKIICKLQMELLTDTIFSSGNSIPGGEDISLRIDQNQMPIVPASTIKGLMRENLENYLGWLEQPSKEILDALFGTETRKAFDFDRRVIPGDLRLEGEKFTADTDADIRMFTALENGVAKPKTLRMAACLHSGLIFSGILLCAEKDFDLLSESIGALRWVGLLRSRGFGKVSVTLEKQGELRSCEAIGRSNVLHYRLKLETPMAVTWLARSGLGLSDDRGYTECRKYLPGSSVRGMVMSELAKRRPEWFQQNKRELLTGITFLNALPMNAGASQIPFPNGFYGDKAKTRFYSVLNQDVLPGDKRVSPGAFCSISQGKLLPYSPQIISSLRIQKKKREMFTTQMIAAGTVLEGYILLNDPAFAADLSAAFSEYITLGADRGAGGGLCHVECIDRQEPAIGQYSFQKGDPIPRKLYLMMVSPGTMKRGGEPVGLDEAQLAALLGVNSVEITACATSVTESYGYNSMIREKEPTVTMYDMGSIFCLTCSSAPAYEKLHALERSGIGIRREEGFGQVLFLKDFAKISGLPKEDSAGHQDTEAAKLRRLRCRWLLDNIKNFPPKGRVRKKPVDLSKSQMGTLQSVCEFALSNDSWDDSQKQEYINRLFVHNIEVRKERNYQEAYRAAQNYLAPIWNGEKPDVNEFAPTYQERLKLTCDLINLIRKG